MLVVEWAVEHGTEVAWGQVAVLRKVVMDGLERVEWDKGIMDKLRRGMRCSGSAGIMGGVVGIMAMSMTSR